MDSGKNCGDRMSGLPDILLAVIISNLPFKEAVATSSIAKRFKDIYRETTNVSFIESEFVKGSDSDSEESVRDARVSFVRFMFEWVSRFPNDAIESFQIVFSKPVGFETEIKHLIEFAVSKKVKNLALDFSDPSCITSNEAAAAVVFHLPECVYNVATLESLKLFACEFDPSKFPYTCSFKSLCFGWIELRTVMDLLLKSPLLESLSIQNCWNVVLEEVTPVYKYTLRELILENCEFALGFTLLDLPNIKIFKYSGKNHLLYFMRVVTTLEEADLDYGAQSRERYFIGKILYDLSSAKKLTVCPYVIQAVRDTDVKVGLEPKMETKHLVIKTNLVPDELVGIRLMINSCPELETLTFQMLPPIPESTNNPRFYSEMYWENALSLECLKKTLKVVEVRNFTDETTYQLTVLRYLIQWGLVLERVDLYVPLGTPESKKTLASAFVRKLWDECEAASDRLSICLHDG